MFLDWLDGVIVNDIMDADLFTILVLMMVVEVNE